MKTRKKGNILAGVIPLAPTKKTIGMLWPDCLHPISDDYTAIERSVYECALAGCDSIWIVCEDDISPLLKKRLGDYILNPSIYEHWDFLKNKSDHKKYIPIFYTPLNRRDSHRRASLGWSVIHGALTAFQVSASISSWLTPSKYYVSFPQALYDPRIVKPHRTAIRGPDAFSLIYHDKTVSEGLCTGFTLNPEAWLHARRNIKARCTGGSKSLPPNDRFSSRNFTLDKIFNTDIIEFKVKVELTEYHEFQNWESLLNYYKSGPQLVKPSKAIIKPYFLKNKQERKQQFEY